MALTDWLANSSDAIRKDPISGVQKSARALRRGFRRRTLRLRGLTAPSPTPVYELGDWDVLVVLDACRVDALRSVAEKYEWLGDIDSYRSVGSMSEEWMKQFDADRWGDEMAETSHLTWNAFEGRALDAADWQHLEGVWRKVWQDGCVPPERMTDRAIRHWRQVNPERLIVHYQQPHRPYPTLRDVERPAHEDVGRTDLDNQTVWDLLRDGELSREAAWQHYTDCLRWALDDITRLVSNLAADRVLLTADHGDLFGEYGLYGHSRGVRVPELVAVPVAELTTVDKHTVEPAATETATDGDATDRLEALGYV